MTAVRPTYVNVGTDSRTHLLKKNVGMEKMSVNSWWYVAGKRKVIFIIICHYCTTSKEDGVQIKQVFPWQNCCVSLATVAGVM